MDKQPKMGFQDDPFAAVEFMAQRRVALIGEVGRVIVGHTEVIDEILTAFLAGGHCLMLGVPGLAKTLLVNTLARAMDLEFRRIQFTPDLMPADITGTNILEEDPVTRSRSFRFQRGPVFTNILLADEINRTPPKTQAALLEAMQENQVTVGDSVYPLPRPFLTLATQNPIEQEGTYALPEAQLDRFFFMIRMDYQSEDEERRIIMETTSGRDEQVRKVLDGEVLVQAQKFVRSIPVSEHVAGYATRLMRATRPGVDGSPEFVERWLRYGCGPRAGQCLLLAAKAHALLHGRHEVACEDIRAFAKPVMRHRLILNFAAISDGVDADGIIERLLKIVPEKV